MVTVSHSASGIRAGDHDTRTGSSILRSGLAIVAILSIVQGVASGSLWLPHHVASNTSRADLVVKGEVVSAEGMQSDGMTVPVRIRVDLVLKGNWSEADLLLKVPALRPGGPDVDPIGRADYGLFFLRAENGGILPYDSRHIRFPVRQGRRPSAADPTESLELVRQELLFTLDGPFSPIQAEAARQLGGLPREMRTVSVLKQLLSARDAALRGGAIEALLLLNESSALVNARDYIREFARDPKAGFQRGLIVWAIRSVTAVEAVDSLKQMLTDNDASVRQAAMEALQHISDPMVIPTFVNALDDKDQNVRYHAVMALSNITLKRQWGPGYSVFKADEKKYIALWKQWWETEGKPEFQQSSGAAGAK